MEFDVPVELLTSLLFVIGVMLEQLILRASAHALALASVTVKLSLEGQAIHSRTIRPALPSNERQLWIKLIHLDLEAHPPQAAILSLTISAEPGSTSKVQFGLFSPQLPEPMQLDVTLARIRAIVGENNVGQAVLNDTHQPDSFPSGFFFCSFRSRK
jgi:protein ImuB